MSGRGLLTHESAGFRRRGFAGSLGWDPAPASARGPSLTLSQTVGVSASGGADALLGRTTLEGLAANDDGNALDRRRLELKLGYGFAALGERFTSTPELGFAMSEGQRDYSLGWRLARESRPGAIGSLELLFEGRRRESVAPGSGAGAGSGPEHGVGFRVTALRRRRGSEGPADSGSMGGPARDGSAMAGWQRPTGRCARRAPRTGWPVRPSPLTAPPLLLRARRSTVRTGAASRGVASRRESRWPVRRKFTGYHV